MPLYRLVIRVSQAGTETRLHSEAWYLLLCLILNTGDELSHIRVLGDGVSTDSASWACDDGHHENGMKMARVSIGCLSP